MSIKRIFILLAAMLTFFAVIGAMAAGLIDFNFPELKRKSPQEEVFMRYLDNPKDETWILRLRKVKKENNRLDI